jgi:drug/metabolite transporter (DMT)-like permease
MYELVETISVLAILLLFIDQIRQLISHTILNGTIRRAIEKDPASLPLLIAKLEPRSRWPGSLAGWIMVVGGVAFAVAAFFENGADRDDAIQLGTVSIVLGVGVLAYSWFVERATRRE